ncbi:hypothetical protein J1605_009439 [Eschrichtius robustus]|uniref:Activator of Hsp90 ATPase AHSA1-like N-terminal domain-containing protein n=1 Tax=Eschrichtius robustus TaxID=9764 RepID=A0AB34GQX9_ESCRO|nr:hypothetical protein J1605_009439 [Eschrichtius robustus]
MIGDVAHSPTEGSQEGNKRRSRFRDVAVSQGLTERDATSWSKGKLCELLVGIAVENEAGGCEISELRQVEGEASCSRRKGKLIFFYEWNIKLGWKGIIKESGAKHKGLIEIPNLS